MDRRGPLTDDLIVGVHAVDEALRAGEWLKRIVVGENRRNDPRLAPLLVHAAERGVAVSFESESAFARLRGRPHQHVIAHAPKFAYAPWGEVRARARASTNGIVVLADHVEDPHNLGAIARTAEAAGALALVIPERRSAGVTAVARRSAAGATSHLAVCQVPNLVRALTDLQSDGYWLVGADAGARASDYTALDLSGKIAVVVGSEGRGLSRLVAERCDFLARIPMHGKVASLNASCATAVVLFEALRQRAEM